MTTHGQPQEPGPRQDDASTVELLRDIHAMSAIALDWALASLAKTENNPNVDHRNTAYERYPDIARMETALNDPQWTHLHELQSGLNACLKRIRTNREAVSSTGPEALDALEAMEQDAIPALESLIERTEGRIDAMLNNVEIYEPDPNPWQRARSLIERTSTSRE